MKKIYFKAHNKKEKKKMRKMKNSLLPHSTNKKIASPVEKLQTCLNGLYSHLTRTKTLTANLSTRIKIKNKLTSTLETREIIESKKKKKKLSKLNTNR
jgi:hypothetical protein